MAKISIIPWIAKKLKRCIGIVEDTDIASQAIASDKYVIWKGDICKSTDDISEGDTLSSNNLSQVSNGIGNDLLEDVTANAQAITKIGKLLYEGTLPATSPSTTNIPDLSKYNIFAAKIASGFSGGPCIGLRYSSTDIRFFGTSLASGGTMVYTLAAMTVSGDNFTGWDTGTYGSKWGTNATGIRDIYGIY